MNTSFTGPDGPCRGRVAALTTHGYEPRIKDAAILLANCPFDALAREHTELVCGMNLATARRSRGPGQ